MTRRVDARKQTSSSAEASRQGVQCNIGRKVPLDDALNRTRMHTPHSATRVAHSRSRNTVLHGAAPAATQSSSLIQAIVRSSR